ncbi:hypothetical protein AVEN_198590-1 [Araneus ventricosus]|uniref:Uncharacterized protein n=1 Tax=Araneus ventricosus TaxID=182803 RepID=A0A4Y2VNS3_ARAVE|nr:hypothetical protein AVEN_198590-1 [Araneus ventricosus]
MTWVRYGRDAIPYPPVPAALAAAWLTFVVSSGSQRALLTSSPSFALVASRGINTAVSRGHAVYAVAACSSPGYRIPVTYWFCSFQRYNHAARSTVNFLYFGTLAASRCCPSPFILLSRPEPFASILIIPYLCTGAYAVSRGMPCVRCGLPHSCE